MKDEINLGKRGGKLGRGQPTPENPKPSDTLPFYQAYFPEVAFNIDGTGELDGLHSFTLYRLSSQV